MFFCRWTQVYNAVLPGATNRAMQQSLSKELSLELVVLVQSIWQLTGWYNHDFVVIFFWFDRLDRVTYAVKKIHIMLSRWFFHQFSWDNHFNANEASLYSHVLLLKILREASLLAKISHPHIVSYKTAWTEPTSGVSCPCIWTQCSVRERNWLLLRSQYVLESGVQGHTSVGIITIKHLNSITAGLVLASADRVTPNCLISHVPRGW